MTLHCLFFLSFALTILTILTTVVKPSFGLNAFFIWHNLPQFVSRSSEPANHMATTPCILAHGHRQRRLVEVVVKLLISWDRRHISTISRVYWKRSQKRGEMSRNVDVTTLLMAGVRGWIRAEPIRERGTVTVTYNQTSSFDQQMCFNDPKNRAKPKNQKKTFTFLFQAFAFSRCDLLGSCD